MFEQDFIMREVQKTVQMIQDIIGLKKEKELDEALKKVGEGYDRFFDLNREDVSSGNFKTLEEKCISDGKFSPNLAFALADIIYEEAEILDEENQSQKAAEKYALVLKLYQRAINEKDAAVPLNATLKMNEIKQKLEKLNS